jgi:transmembrane sensor
VTSTSKRIQQQATRWVVKSQLAPLTSAEEAELQHWLSSDPRHKGAYIRANLVRATIERVAALVGAKTPSAAEPRRLFAQWARLRKPMAVAAGLAALALSSVVGLEIYNNIRGETYTSGIGERRQVALDDGSSILLNTATNAVVHWTPTLREVSLTRGEAVFEVAKDPNRPFVVRAGVTTVKAIGTAFVVRNDGGRVDVIVTEGVVEVMRTDGALTQRLTAGHRAQIARAQPTHLETLAASETRRELAWETGWLEFDGQPLGEAVEQINRHNRRHVVVTDAALARRPIIGSFRAIDARGFANIAAATFDAEVIEDGDTLRIVPKSAHTRN